MGPVKALQAHNTSLRFEAASFSWNAACFKDRGKTLTAAIAIPDILLKISKLPCSLTHISTTAVTSQESRQKASMELSIAPELQPSYALTYSETLHIFNRRIWNLLIKSTEEKACRYSILSILLKMLSIF
jgi:hypothetical protein